MTSTWSHDRSAEHIEKKMEDVKDVVIKDYARDMSLESIPTNAAYRVDGVHLYAEILNVEDMLNIHDVEGTDCHKRTLRFFDQHYRAVKRILDEVDAKRVDFHNQRLHALFAKPYNSETDAEKKRIQRAVATAQLVIDVLAQTADDDEKIPAAKVRVGIDTGITLAVNNGRNGYREPLFLGDAANHAAKMASNGTAKGIYLTNAARSALGLEEQKEPIKVALTAAEIDTCVTAANLGVTAEAIVKAWREDMDNNPIGGFAFTRQTPPLKDMDIASLTPANSKRQESVSVFADIDGFTKYVANHIDDNTEDVVRTLHVIRAELERVLTTEFGGRRVRFIGDCLHGLICEGTSQTTDAELTISEATRLAGGLRSSFELALEKLQESGYETGDLGLAIGLDYGPISVTRLGRKGDRVRCAFGRSVIASETEQSNCKGDETAIGQAAYDAANEAVRTMFGKSRKVSNLDYLEATEALADSGDKSAKVARSQAYVNAAPAIISAEARDVRPYTALPERE